MEDPKRNILKAKIRHKLESYMREHGIKYSKKLLAEKTQGEIDAEKKEMDQRIKTKEEQIKALQDQIAVLKTAQGKSASEKPDEIS
jgi:hypothetical protein|tara:strand:- start:8893 stop:9150 length:258 start_codon:yes stop_codon:yes gene_type:complete